MNIKQLTTTPELEIPKDTRRAYSEFLQELSEPFFTACFDYNFDRMETSPAVCPVTFSFQCM